MTTRRAVPASQVNHTITGWNVSTHTNSEKADKAYDLCNDKEQRMDAAAKKVLDLSARMQKMDVCNSDDIALLIEAIGDFDDARLRHSDAVSTAHTLMVDIADMADIAERNEHLFDELKRAENCGSMHVVRDMVNLASEQAGGAFGDHNPEARALRALSNIKF